MKIYDFPFHLFSLLRVNEYVKKERKKSKKQYTVSSGTVW